MTSRPSGWRRVRTALGLNLGTVVRVCWARLPRVARYSRTLPRRRIGRRREATSTAPAQTPLAGTGRPRQRHGKRAATNGELRFPSRTYPSRKPLASAPSRLRDNAVPDHEVRSRSRPARCNGSPACRLPTPTDHIPMQRDASSTAHSRPSRSTASTSTGIEPAKRPTAPRLLHASPSATGPGGRYMNVGASHRGPPLLGSRARTVEGSEA